MDFITTLKKYTEYQKGISKEVVKLLYEDTSFNNTVFSGYDINYSSFLEVIFNNCDFSTVYMSGASMCGSSFNNCIFLNNRFRKGVAEYAKFSKTDLLCIDTFRTSFYETAFENLNIVEAKMIRSWFEGAHFFNVKFIKTDLTEANFSNSTFKNVIFEDCNFIKTKFNNTKGLDQVEFINSSIIINGEIKTNLGNEILKLF